MTDHSDTKNKIKSQLYKASWIDRFTGWIRRLPGPSWAYYFGLGVLLFLIPIIVMWAEGTPLNGTVLSAYAFLSGAIVFIFFLLHYLDERVEKAFAVLQPALTINEDVYKLINYQLTTLPAGRTLLASLVAIALVFLSEYLGKPYRLESLSSFPISAFLLRFFYLACWWVFGAFLYHTIHQLSMINRIYTSHTQINLFRLKPLYAFSSISALTAGSITVLPYGFLIVNQIESLELSSLILVLLIQLIAIVTFIWPQLGIHGLQIAEKDRLLDEANQRFETTIHELHRRVDDKQLDKIAELNTTVTTLEKEMNILRKIPTWPWQPETVRWLITALVLPLGLWVIQFVLQRVLAP